jgi:hypothetical protein
VLFTFVSVLGFMLFAFKEVPTAAQPFVELVIVLTFFGWAWVLNHLNAVRVAKAMELLGGMILPLVWYAALVDSAGVPPDAEGGALVVALTMSSLALAAVYWFISRRFENSMLRFLVWPMVWVAAMGVGFAFKSDEPLLGDAITRLVAPQPALASIAIAGSLAFLRWKPTSRLTDATYTAALVGIPAAYLLTFGLSFGDGNSVLWPIVVSGAGTVASVEFVSYHFGWMEKMRTVRPYVYVLVGIPLVLTIGIGWGGAIIALGYVLLVEVAIRSTKFTMHDIASAGAGVAVGLALSLVEPGAAVVAFGLVSVWAHVRRRAATDDSRVVRAAVATAAVAPIGLLYGLTELTTTTTSLLVVGGIVLIGAAITRFVGVGDDFDSVWFPAAASAVGLASAVVWVSEGTSAGVVVATVAVSTAIVALGQRWPTGNLWLGAGLASMALAITLDALDISGGSVAFVWSAVGILTIAGSVFSGGGSKLRISPGHLSVLGHVVGLVAFTASNEPHGLTIAITGWAIGWAISFVATERHGGVDPLDVWHRTGDAAGDSAATLEEQLAAVAPSLAVTTAAAAAVAIFFDAAGDSGSLVWVGVILGLVAVVYALIARLLLADGHGRVVFSWAAALLAVVGVAVSYTEPLAAAVTTVAVVAVRLQLLHVQRLTWLTWIAWLMPAVAATAVAAHVGMREESLAAVTLLVAIGMLLLALGIDEVLSGPRSTGEFTRADWLQPPSALGGLLIPVSVGVLWLAGSDIREWASAIAVLALAIASGMLRRSIWLTTILGSVSLAIALHAGNAPAIGSAVLWSVMGLIVLAAAPVFPKLLRDDVAGVGHMVGAVGLAYAYDPTALVIAVPAWAVGWLIGVTSLELGGPSIARVLERSSRWWDENYVSWTATVSKALVPLAAVVTLTAAAFVVIDQLVDIADTQAWFGAVVGGLGLAFAAAGSHLTRTRLTSVVLGWSGLVLAVTAIVVAAPENLLIAAAAATAIVTRLVVGKLIPDAWVTWVAWLLPTVVASSIGAELGIDNAALGIVPIATGAMMLLGSVLLDRVGRKPRVTGDLIAHTWLIAPAVLGAVLMLGGLVSLIAAEADIRIEGAATVALVYAAASFVLRRSIWITSLLGSVGLALLLEAIDASSVQSAMAWAILGLVVVATVPLVKSVAQGELAVIGHLLGAVAFAYGFETAVYLIAITAWAIGWLLSVIATEIGQPSASDIVSRRSDLSEGEQHSAFARVVLTIPPLLAVTTSTAAALSLYVELTDFGETKVWTAAVVAGLARLFAAGARLFLSDGPAPTIFGWASILLASASVVVAIGDDGPVVVAASAFIVVRILLMGAIPHTWLSWPAWLMPIVIAMAAGHALGVPAQSVYLLSLFVGTAMLVGSLIVDDVANSRRSLGEGLRTSWLRYPFVVGLLVVPLSLAPVFALDTTTVGVTSLTAAAGYLIVAILLRAGSVTLPALGLAMFGTAILTHESSIEASWLLVVMSAVAVMWSFIAERMQSKEAAVNPWTRWDLPALVVAHVATMIALALTLDGSPDPAIWIAAGALSMVVGLWRSNRWWIDAGLLLIIVGSAVVGEPWLIAALVVTSVRGMYGVWRGVGIGRYIDHSIAVAAFVAAWVDVSFWFEWSIMERASFTSLAAGSVAVVTAVLSHKLLVKKDTFVLWSMLGVSGVVVATVWGFAAEPSGLDSPWLGSGIVLAAIATEQWARVLHRNLRYATPFVATFGWLAVVGGLGLSDMASAYVIVGSLGLTLSVMMSFSDRLIAHAEPDEVYHLVVVARIWAGITLASVAATCSLAISPDSPDTWWLAATGLAFTTIAAATGSRAVGVPRLRSGSGIPALGAVAAALFASGVSPFGIGVALTISASVVTLLSAVLATRRRQSVWLEMGVITSMVATMLAVPISLIEYPATELIMLILVVVGGQAIAYGMVFERQPLVAVGPPFLGIAAIVLAVESASGVALWYTVPIAVVMLVESDILRPIVRGDSDNRGSLGLVILEWSGVALLGLPPLIEMFRTNIAFGLLGFGLAVGLMAWALLTRVKRRVLAACVVATSSTMLSLAAATASNVDDSAAFWILGAGVGFSIMLIAGFVEAYRSRSGALMRRLGDLMEEWE